MVTSRAAEVARLPATEIAEGSGADLVLLSSLPRLLSGDRRAIVGLWREGDLAYGRREWLPNGTPIVVEGEARALLGAVRGRVRALFHRYPQVCARRCGRRRSSRTDAPGTPRRVCYHRFPHYR